MLPCCKNGYWYLRWMNVGGTMSPRPCVLVEWLHCVLINWPQDDVHCGARYGGSSPTPRVGITSQRNNSRTLKEPQNAVLIFLFHPIGPKTGYPASPLAFRGPACPGWRRAEGPPRGGTPAGRRGRGSALPGGRAGVNQKKIAKMLELG